MRLFVVSVLTALVLAGPAMGAISSRDEIVNDVSPEEISALFGELNGTMTVKKTWENGDVGMTGKVGNIDINVGMTACEQGRCAILAVFVILRDNKATLDFINVFNRDAPVGKVFRLPENEVAIVETAITAGGVTRAHLAAEVIANIALLERYLKKRSELPDGASASAPESLAPILGFTSSAAGLDDAAPDWTALGLGDGLAEWMRKRPAMDAASIKP